jgi:hypothetical protein
MHLENLLYGVYRISPNRHLLFHSIQATSQQLQNRRIPLQLISVTSVSTHESKLPNPAVKITSCTKGLPQKHHFVQLFPPPQHQVTCPLINLLCALIVPLPRRLLHDSPFYIYRHTRKEFS